MTRLRGRGRFSHGGGEKKETFELKNMKEKGGDEPDLLIRERKGDRLLV